MRDLGLVLIGRNEGERLARCITPLLLAGHPLIYVDSGSTDGSPGRARAMGAPVLELDERKPYTAARARNAGLSHLLVRRPEMRWVQFVDVDAEIVPGWLERATQLLEREPQLAIVEGEVREGDPRASVYHTLCDVEWRRPPGPTRACGGIFMARVEALRDVDGFDERWIAAEDTDLCLRLVSRGWRLYRLPLPMAVHDAALFGFGQWWRRTVRAGYAGAQVAWVHGWSSRDLGARQMRSVLVWALLVPALALLPALASSGVSLLLLALYPALWWRVERRFRGRGNAPSNARWYATFVLVGMPALAQGALAFALSLCRDRPHPLFEYKQTTPRIAAGAAPELPMGRTP